MPRRTSAELTSSRPGLSHNNPRSREETGLAAAGDNAMSNAVRRRSRRVRRRRSAACTRARAMSVEGARVLYVFGGRGKGGALDDLHMLDLEGNLWSRASEAPRREAGGAVRPLGGVPQLAALLLRRPLARAVDLQLRRGGREDVDRREAQGEARGSARRTPRRSTTSSCSRRTRRAAPSRASPSRTSVGGARAPSPVPAPVAACPTSMPPRSSPTRATPPSDAHVVLGGQLRRDRPQRRPPPRPPTKTLDQPRAGGGGPDALAAVRAHGDVHPRQAHRHRPRRHRRQAPRRRRRRRRRPRVPSTRRASRS